MAKTEFTPTTTPATPTTVGRCAPKLSCACGATRFEICRFDDGVWLLCDNCDAQYKIADVLTKLQEA
jgi:hypothetical protein